jgi:transcriptional regulator with PAS, ATPase and Fis domain
MTPVIDGPRPTRQIVLATYGSIRRSRVRLTVEQGPGAGRAYSVERGLIRIGTAADNDVALEDEFMSTHHVELELREEGFLLRDLGSTNGTWIGGFRIREAYVAPGAVLGLGKTALRLAADGTYEVALASPRGTPITGESLVMRECVAQLERYAASEQPVLLQGETGVGKDLFARTLHELSSRRAGPFEVFDCGAASPALIEAEIFGHVRGAFTDAKEGRAGAFERASGGTLFIDEVGELPLELQPKLLRILEQRKVRRLGDTRDIPIDVRVVAATNRDLVASMAERSFRADLYYRLNVLRLEIPPLRRRKEDIARLAQVVLAEAGARELDEDALRILLSYDWPGNVRELKNVLQRAAVLAQGTIGAASIVLGQCASRAPELETVKLDLSYHDAKERCVERFERAYVTELLARHDHNVSRAAESARIPRQTLHRIMSRHGLR